MKCQKISLITALVACIGFSSQLLASQWEFVREKNNVKVYKMEVPGSPLIAFKGIMTMDAPITKVAQVLVDRDADSKKTWVDMIEDFEILEGDDMSAVSYSSYDLPWPLDSRDYVVRSDLTIDNTKNEIRLSLKSTTHKKAPKTKGVRASLTKSRYVLKPKPGNKTWVKVEIQTDPKGNLPAWLVNIIQKDWPSNTLSKLEKQAQKDSTEHNKTVLEKMTSLKRYSLVD